ncbi:MAG TPA: MFS transporter [Jiangellaceae bacterium]|nr:MFS transporter [Jiangellaceae bacterium]
MFGPYLRVLRTPGALAFSASGLVARLPMSMFGIGIVLAISVTEGTYGQAGLVAGTALLAQAAAAPLQARIADRIGQRRMLLPVLALHTVGLGSFILLLGGAPVVALVATSALAGATLPSFGSLVRARWARLHTGTPLLHTAYALESVLDEVVFVVGPVLATILATGVHPLSGLVTNLALTVGGGLWFAAQRATEPPPRPRTRASAVERLSPRSLGWVVLTFVFMGGIFGSVEVVTVAFADHAGSTRAAGVVLALYALGSLLSGLVVGAVHWRSGPRRRFALGQLVMAAALFPLPFVGSVPLLAVVMFVAGLAISPTLIAGFSLVEAEVPASRLTEGLAWISTALNIGVSIGAAVAGPVIDRAGASPGFVVALSCGLLAAVVCVTGALARPRVRESV